MASFLDVRVFAGFKVIDLKNNKMFAFKGARRRRFFSKGALWGRDPAATGRRRNDALLYVNNSMFYCNTLYLNERVSQDSQASFTGRAFGKTFVWRICLLQYVCFGKERFLHVFKTFLKMQCIIKHHFLLIHDTLLIPWYQKPFEHEKCSHV